MIKKFGRILILIRLFKMYMIYLFKCYKMKLFWGFKFKEYFMVYFLEWVWVNCRFWGYFVDRWCWVLFGCSRLVYRKRVVWCNELEGMLL